jgi:hypothetical protein
MNISDWIRSCARCALALGILAGYAQAQDTRSTPASNKPNVVLVLTDNLGWGEPGVYGGGILRGAPTPRIDQLAAEGMRLLNFNVEAQCTLSRAALLTGRYANVGQKEYPRSNANPSWKIGTRGASRTRFCPAQQIHQAIQLSSTPRPNRIDPKYLIAAHPTPRVCDELRDGLTIGFVRNVMFSLAPSGALATSAVHAQTPPKMKMTTDIPAAITTPDKVETRLGTLKFFDGFPDDGARRSMRTARAFAVRGRTTIKPYSLWKT